MLGLGDYFDYFQCSSCLCLQIGEVPADLTRYYPADYHGYNLPRSNPYGGVAGALRKLLDEATLFPDSRLKQLVRSLFPSVQYQILSRFAGQKNTHVLDVGCGRGKFLYPLYAFGMTNVRGIEPFIPDKLCYANGFTIEKGFVTDATGHWDIIIYNHAFEHVPDPLTDLKAVHRLLKPEGVAIIRIPTVSSFAWEHYRTNWFQIDAPRHLFVHSVESMGVLATQANLSLTDVIYDSTEAQFLNSELYKRGIPLPDRRNELSGLSNYIRYKVDKWRYARKAKQLNEQKRGDQAAFILRKAHHGSFADTANFPASGYPAQ